MKYVGLNNAKLA